MIRLCGVSVKVHAHGCTAVISYTQPMSDNKSELTFMRRGTASV